MDIVAVIVNYKTADLVFDCLKSLSQERAARPGLRAIVVDNASPDNSAEVLAQGLAGPAFRDWVEFVPAQINGGFGWGCNQGILRALQSAQPPEAIYLINPDARPSAGALSHLTQIMAENPRAGAVGSQLRNPDGTFAGSAFRFPSVGREWLRGHGIEKLARVVGIQPTVVASGAPCKVDWVTGASVLLRSEALRDAGLFDTGFFLYFEEVELMYRFRKKGWTSHYCPQSEVVHIAGASTGVVDGKAAGRKSPPDYVFTARSRFFALSKGSQTAFAANLSWMAGFALGRVAHVLSFGRRRAPEWKEVSTRIRLGLWPRKKDCTPAVEAWQAAAGTTPAWMIEP